MDNVWLTPPQLLPKTGLAPGWPQWPGQLWTRKHGFSSMAGPHRGTAAVARAATQLAPSGHECLPGRKQVANKRNEISMPGHTICGRRSPRARNRPLAAPGLLRVLLGLLRLLGLLGLAASAVPNKCDLRKTSDHDALPEVAPPRFDF